MARIELAEEQARKAKRQNAEAEGLYVLRSSVEMQVVRQIAQEVAQVDTMLREGAMRVADDLGVDYKRVRQVLLQCWREHRTSRSSAAARVTEIATLTDAEADEDI